VIDNNYHRFLLSHPWLLPLENLERHVKEVPLGMSPRPLPPDGFHLWTTLFWTFSKVFLTGSLTSLIHGWTYSLAPPPEVYSSSRTSHNETPFCPRFMSGFLSIRRSKVKPKSHKMLECVNISFKKTMLEIGRMSAI
jgi:hypothetical protein